MAMGSMAMMVVMAVMRIGRKREKNLCHPRLKSLRRMALVFFVLCNLL